MQQLPIDDVPHDLPRVIDVGVDFIVPERDGDDEPFNDVDENPAADTGVYLPPNSLAIGAEALQQALDGLKGWLILI